MCLRLAVTVTLCTAALVTTAADSSAQVEFVVDRSIGALDHPAQEVFGRYIVPNVAADGTLFAADVGTGEIRVFDPRGEYVRSFGGEGEGPGEFVDIVSIDFSTDGDSVYVYDGALHRVTTFLRDGRLSGDFRPEMSPGGTLRMLRHSSGVFVFVGAVTDGDGLVHVVGENGAHIRSFAPFDAFQVAESNPAAAVRGQLAHAFVNELHSGDLVVALAAPYRLARFTLEGDRRWIITDDVLPDPMESITYSRDRFQVALYPQITAVHALNGNRVAVLFADFEDESRRMDVRDATTGELISRQPLSYQRHVSAVTSTAAGDELLVLTDKMPYPRIHVARWQRN